MSEQQFADAVGVSRGAVQQWEKPGGTAPKRANQPRVAQVLGISVAELASGGSSIDRGLHVRAEVPLIPAADAAGFADIDNSRPQGDFPTVAVSVPVKRHTYAVKVDGDMMVSMSGDSFPEGSILIVEPDMEAVSGDYVIVLATGGGISFKQLVHDGNETFLKPLNNRYPVRSLERDRIIGVVREFTKRFR